MRPLRGTNAVVTGSSSGIGKQIAIEFAASGCERLLIHFHRNRDAAEATAKQVRDLGAEVTVDHCDFSEAAQSLAFVDRAFQRWPAIDTWVHCAGADVLTGEAANESFEQKLRRLIDVDLVGSIQTGRAAGERLRTQGKSAADGPPPSMIFIAWDQASEGMEGDAGQMFAPVKAGVDAFAKSLAQELAPWVRVNVIAPGWIKTAWGENTSGYWNDRAVHQSLMHRWGHPADIAAAAVFLSTPANQFVTAQTIVINGGWNRRYDVANTASPRRPKRP
ncbi:MAG: SDR family NAD(P)-dependent oxidoreductase [Planctomycetaceae bacterium]